MFIQKYYGCNISQQYTSFAHVIFFGLIKDRNCLVSMVFPVLLLKYVNNDGHYSNSANRKYDKCIFNSGYDNQFFKLNN